MSAQHTPGRTTRPFSFAPANPVCGRRGIDANARMWIRIDAQRAVQDCVRQDRRWNPVDIAKATGSAS